MKTFKIITMMLAISLVSFTSCKKDAGMIGKKEITGTVTYKNGATGTNDAAANALIHIAFGTKDATTTYDQTVASGTDGKYLITGLAKGDYFITAEYTDGNGVYYTTAGYSLTIGDPKAALTLDITLQ